jgi:predicted anti-sigma-YlaC factor YlaD
MTRHFSEADLLETYYTQPGESMPVMMHLAKCSECAAKYDRLERKIREAAACSTEKPDTFWAFQRHAIMRRVAGAQQERRLRAPLRVAAAAALAFTVGGFVMYRQNEQAVQKPAPAPVVVEKAVPADPWESEALQEFQPVVEWESWVEEGTL